MIIFERSVTKEYWAASVDYLNRRLALGQYREITGTNVIEVPGGQFTTSYAILANDLPVAWLCLRKRPTWAAYEVTQTFVFPELRGLGLATQLYCAAINHDGILLASGKTQSKTSRALWKRFIEHRTFNIWAQDFNNVALISGIEYFEDELYCALPVYTVNPSKHDVRLIARKN